MRARNRSILAFAAALIFLEAAAGAVDVAPPPQGADPVQEQEIPDADAPADRGPEASTPPVTQPAPPAAAAPSPSPRPAPSPPAHGRAASPEGAPAVTPAPAAAAPSRPAPSGNFLVKFNNADVYEVIHTLGRIAGINYLIDPRVRGVVNVHTQGSVRKEEAMDLLFAILRVNGATAVKEGGLYHIVPMADVRTAPLALEAGKEAVPSGRPVMQAFPLQYISAADMAKVIRPFLTAGGDATEVPRANMLLVTDTASNMEKHARLVELFDADAFRSAGVNLFRLKYLDPEEMARNLETIFGALDFGARGGKPAGVNFVPIPRIGALLAVAASPKTMEDVTRWVGELDRETTGTSRAVHLYRVRHGKVKDVAAILEKLYPGRTSRIPSKPTEFRPQIGNGPARSEYQPGQTLPPAAPPTTPAVPPPANKQSAAPAPAKEGEEAGYDIIPDEPTNSIVIRGSASEYAQILETLKVIDVYPWQVLLEVLIAEVRLDDALKLGIDWTYIQKSGDYAHRIDLNTSLEAQKIGESGIQGLRYLVDKTDRLTAAFRALANDDKVSILSSPSVISTNGKKSKIDVSDSVPIVTGRVTSVANGDTITETVEYRDVGVILNFTPYINDVGLVTLEVEQEISEVVPTTVGSLNNPTFFKRSVNTTLMASGDRSIVLGGLVREKRERARDGVPFLYKIPFVGWIFGARSGALSRSELLIFITPRVIGSVEEGTRLSREFEERVGELKTRIREATGMRPPPPPDDKIELHP